MFISTAMHIGKEIFQCYMFVAYIIELYCYRLDLVLVDTTKGIKEVSDFFGVMEVTSFLFSFNTQA